MPEQAEVVQRLDEEARVQQVAGRVVDAADVLVDGHPVVDDPAVPGRLVVVRVAVAQEVPGRVDERVHRVGLPRRGLAALRTGDVHPLLVGGERRHALRPILLDLRQDDRQLILGDGHGAVVLAVDDRDRAAPVALARHRPVAQAVRDRRSAASLLAQRLDDHCHGLAGRPAAELAGVDQDVGLLVDHRPNRQVVALGELTVALVVRRHGHDRARPVVHQDVVGDPDRYPLVVDRVHDEVAGEDAVLVLRLPLLDRARAGFLHVLAHLVGRQPLDQRMLGREHEERRAEQRVGPRREDRDVDVQLLVAEQHFRALRATDPVALDRLRLLGPVDQVEVVQQLVGVRGDPKEPLHHVPRDDGRAATLAPAVDHVLVGDDRLVLRAPVDRRLLAIGQPRLEELQEQPLRPAVVLDLVCRRLAVPVDHPAQASHLGADVRDVPLHDLARMPALADRGILGGQAERVEAHRAHHAPAGAPPVMRDHIAQRVVEDVPHVQRPGGVREHLEHVELPLRLAAGLGVRRVEGPLGLPDLLPLPLDCVRLVRVHVCLRVQKSLSTLRGHGKLRAALAAFASCAREGAPAAFHFDCTKLTESTP